MENNMETRELQKIEGTVESVTFHNSDSGWTVLEINYNDELTTVVGILPEIYEGEHIKVMGDWTTHATFGLQFKAELCERALPATAPAILRYLASGAVKGVGPATATKIIMKFGEQALDVIENEPGRLCQIRGISPSKARAISEDFAQKFGVREAMLFLGQFGITPAEAMRAFKKWGTTTIDRVKESPYNLCIEGLGISFERADAIAASMDRPQDDSFRICAGILYILRHNLNNGHSCLPREKVVQTASRLLGVSGELVDRSLREMAGGMQIVCETINTRDYIYLPHLHKAESYLAGRISLMLDFSPPPVADIDRLIENAMQSTGIQYGVLQKKAITQALSKGILILTGGPGTGKTTTLNAIIRLLEDNGEKVAIAAPTGRAAKRISELTGRDAKTIHRLLEVEWTDGDKPVFARNEKNPLESEAIIIDELSMVDVLLFENLIRAMRLGCRLIMVGDADQLPSVGAGSVLSDLIDSGLLPVVALDEVFRQAKRSLIVTNAHKIVRGQIPDVQRKDSDFFFMPVNDAAGITEVICDLYQKRLPAAYGYSPMKDIQVLCPSRKGELGSVRLGIAIQSIINPPGKSKKEVTVNGIVLRQGDKIMQMKNNYDICWTKDNGKEGTGIFNGDIGILESVDAKSSSFTIRFDDRLALYTLEDAASLEPAYAVTVHKSQGSEFPAVIIPMYPGPPQLCYRNLLYTAVTRAKSLLILVGHRKTMIDMIENNRKTKRYTGLCALLQGEYTPDAK